MSYSWCFIDLGGLRYDIMTPDTEPLGGSESALCYLIRALQRRGERVTLVNHSELNTQAHGIRYADPGCVHALDFWQDFDLVVSLNRCAPLFVPILPEHCRRIYWTQHNHQVTELPEDLARSDLDAIVFVSDWQMQQFRSHFDLQARDYQVVRNAASQASCTSQRRPHRHARLAYTSTPGRGLGVLIAIFPALKKLFPALSLDVFSSMAVYQSHPLVEAQYTQLYENCKGLPDVMLHGSVSQPDLAEALAGMDILAYPNTYMETSCIAALEALASGLRVVTTAWGALPETLDGWGKLVPYQADMGAFCLSFFEGLRRELLDFYQAPEQWQARQGRQQAHWRSRLDWDRQAQAWLALAARWGAGA